MQSKYYIIFDYQVAYAYENITWKDYTHTIEKKKKVKNVGLLYYGKQLLNVESRKTISFMGQCIFYKINDNPWSTKLCSVNHI